MAILEDLNTLQEDIRFTFANRLKCKHIMWTKHKMNVSMAAQTLSHSVASAIDFLQGEMELSEFEGSKHTSEFIKGIDTVFDLLNNRNPFIKENKAPVTSKSLEAWSTKCRELANYMFDFKDEKGNLPWNGRTKIVIWGFSFSLHSVASICKELLTHKYLPYRFVLTYKFSWDHIELLFNKISRCCGWNNNPNVMEFKYAIRRIILSNSIEPSKTCNCTSFEDSLCKPGDLIDFSSKWRSTSSAEDYFFADDWDVQ